MRTPRLLTTRRRRPVRRRSAASPPPRPRSRAGSATGRRGQPAQLQPQGPGQPQGRGQHHLLGVGLAGQPDDAAVDHQRLQLVAVQGARHPGDPGRLRRHLAEVPGRPHQRAAARRRPARGPAHPGRHRHRLVPARAVVHERGQVLDERLPAPPARLLEGQRRAVGAPLRRLGADPLLQPERLHEGRPQPGRPADHALPDGDATPRRSRPRAAAWAWCSTPGTSRRGWPRPTSCSSTTRTGAAPGPPRRRSTPRPSVSIFSQLDQLVQLGRRHHQPVDGARRVRQPARHREREVRHDHRDLGRAGHGDPAARQAASTPT